MKHLLSSKDLDKKEILDLFGRAEDFLPTVKGRTKLDLAKGKILATLFYEPSTRTRFSFEAAMLRLGGGVVSNPLMEETSSSTKGESLYDTGRTVSQMADVIAMRHKLTGAVAELAKGATVPVMNAGDGALDHPTQGLLDLFTIQRDLGRLENFTIGIVGDLKNSRVAHSQCEFLKNFPGIRYVFVSPEGLKMPDEVKEVLLGLNTTVMETDNLEAVLPELDVLSVTRIQKERFSSVDEYEKYKGVYVITPSLMAMAKKPMILIHPLPRVDEIEVTVDSDPRAKYFEQVENGVALRMALIATLLGL